MAHDKAFRGSRTARPDRPQRGTRTTSRTRGSSASSRSTRRARRRRGRRRHGREVRQDDGGIAGAAARQSGDGATADLYVDCSAGSRRRCSARRSASRSSASSRSLFCDRAVVGGWDRARRRADHQPYTTGETMDAGWCWQIEHEHRINRGYVYSSAFISDDEAEREFRRKNPRVGPTRVVKFVCGRVRAGVGEERRRRSATPAGSSSRWRRRRWA